MNEKTSLILLNLVRVLFVTLIMFFGFALLIYNIFDWTLSGGWPPIPEPESFFQVLGRFFSLNWPETIDGGVPSFQLFLENGYTTRDLSLLAFLCGGIPGLVIGIKNRGKERFKLRNYLFFGLIVPVGVFISYLEFTPLFPLGLTIPIISYGDPEVITGSRILDSLLSLDFYYFADYLWHLILPAILLSFVMFFLLYWLIRGIHKDKENIEQNWQKISLRVLGAYLVFSLMLDQAHQVFMLKPGITNIFYNLLLYREPSVMMISLYYLSRVVGIYLITNLICIGIASRKSGVLEESKTEQNLPEKELFLRNKSNLILILALGVLFVLFTTFSIISLIPAFTAGGISYSDDLFKTLIWGVRHSSMIGFFVFLGLTMIGSAVSIPFALIRKKHSIGTNPKKRGGLGFLTQLCRDLLIFLFIPLCIFSSSFESVAWILFGPIGWNLYSFSARLIILLSPVILLTIKIPSNTITKNSIRSQLLTIMQICCILSIGALIFMDTLGNANSVHFGWSGDFSILFYSKIMFPLANLTGTALLTIEPIKVILAGLLIVSFYVFWYLLFTLLKRLEKYQFQKILHDVIT